MKLKKLMLSMFAVAATATMVGGLTSCGGDSSNKTGSGNKTNITVGESDLDKVNAALSQLKIENTYTSGFTLTVRGVGGVAISYQSSNEKVFKIAEDGSVTIVRPAFGQEDVKITLTATLKLNDATTTKTYEITIPAVVDESKTVAEIKELEDKTVTYAKGVVTGFLYGGTEEQKVGFYLTDSTGTIYVYGPTAAQEVEKDNYVYVGGTKSSFTGNKDTTLQFTTGQLSADSDKVTVLKETGELDTSSFITDKTLSEVNALAKDSLTNVYEMVCKVEVNSYGAYNLTDVITKEQILIYYNGSTSADKQYVYDDDLEAANGEIVKVRFYANSLNSSGKVRGNVLDVLQINDKDKTDTVIAGVSKLIKDNYSVSTDVVINNVWEDVEVEVDTHSSNLITYDTEENLLTINALETEITEEIDVTAKVGNTTSTKKFTITTKEDLTSIREGLMTFDAYIKAAKNAAVKVEGVVTYILDEKNRVIADDEGNYYLIYGLLAEDYKLGDRLVITGAKDIYNGMHEVKAPSGGTLEIVKIKKDEELFDVTNLNEYIIYNNEFKVATEIQAKPVYLQGLVKEVSEDGKVVTVTIHGFDVYLVLGTADKEFLTKYPVNTLIYADGYLSYNTGNKDKESQVSISDESISISTNFAYINYLLDGINEITSPISIDLSSAVIEDGFTLSVIIPAEAAEIAQYDEQTKILTLTPGEINSTVEIEFKFVKDDEEESSILRFEVLALTEEAKVDSTLDEIKKLFSSETYNADTVVQINQKYADATIAVSYSDDAKTLTTSTVGTSTKVNIRPLGTENTETLTITVTCGETSKNIEVKVKSSFGYDMEAVNKDIMTHATYITKADKAAIKVKGVVGYIQSNKDMYIYDEDGNAYYVYDSTGKLNAYNLGDEIVVDGKMSIYNNILEAVPTTIYRIDANKAVQIPTDATEDLATNGLKVEKAQQGQLVTITGIFDGIASDNKAITLKVGEKTIAVQLKTADKTLAKKLVKGSSITVVGVKSVFKTDVQISAISADIVDNSTDTEKMELLKTIISGLFEEKYDSKAVINLDIFDAEGYSINVNLNNTADVTYDAEKKELTIEPTDTSVTANITISLAINNVTDTVSIAYTSKKKAEMVSGETATVTAASTVETSYQDLTADTAANAELIGLDAEIFEVSFAKNSAGTNTRAAAGSIKIYNKKDTTDGGSLTVAVKEGYTIQTIKITIASTSTSGSYTITVNASEVTATDGVYTINGTSFTIKNTDEPNNQLHIASIEITFKKN